MNLLQVTVRYAPFVGGTETHTWQVSKRLVEMGHRVTVLTTQLDSNLAPVQVCEGVEIRRVRAYPRARDYYFAPALTRVITQTAWDVVHVQGYHTLVAPLAMWAAQRANIPYVVTFHSGGHSSRARSKLRAAHYALLRPFLARAMRLVGVSNFEADFFANALGLERSRFAVIPNGGYLPKPNHKPACDETLILSVGRLEKYKGHHRILEALPRVLERHPNARLRLVGSGPYESNLRALAHTLGIGQHVEIRGLPAADRAGMAELLSRAALVILFSEYEAHAIAVMEALTLRRPVLVADATGLHELVARGLARGVPLHSTREQLADAIDAQLTAPLIPPSVALPTWDECADSLARLYQEMLAEKHHVYAHGQHHCHEL